MSPLPTTYASRRAILRRLYRAARGKCAYCGRHCTLRRLAKYAPGRPDDATIDHEIPQSRGGADSPENWRLCCRECNGRKDDLTGDEFRRAMR